MIIIRELSLVMSMFGQANGTLTLQQAINLATLNSYSVKTAKSTVRNNEQKVREAKASGGVQIQTGYNYLRFGQQQTGDLGGQIVQFQPLDTNTVVSTLSFPIDLSGIVRSSIKAAKDGVDASRFSQIATENDLRNSVRKSYYGVLQAKSLLEVAEQTKANIAARVDQAQKQFNAGFIAKIDLERLKAQLSQTESDLINAKNGLQLAKNLLNLAMTRPIETELEVDNISELPDFESNVNLLVSAAQKQRPEVISIDKNLIALAASKRIAGQGMKPSLNFALQNSTSLDPAGFNPQREVNTTSLNLAIPLYDSGQTRAKVAQTEELIIQTNYNRSALLLSISQETRSAVTSLNNAKARFENSKKQIKLAEEVARIARVRRNAGEGTVLEIIDAETQLAVASNGLITATFDYLTSYADLQRAVGNDNIKEAIEKVKSTEAKGTGVKK
jgi:outer membrane protein